MCDNITEIEDSVHISKFPNISSSFPICNKCHTQISSFWYTHNHPVCHDCLISTVQGRFRHIIRIQCKVYRNAKIIVSTTGGVCSYALINLLSSCISPISRKRLSIHIEVCFLLDNNMKNDSDTLERIKKIEKLCKEFEFPFHIIPSKTDNTIESSFIKNSSNYSQNNTNNTDKKNDHELIFLSHDHLLADYSNKNKFYAVVLEDTANDISRTCLSLICKGQGVSVPLVNQFICYKFGMNFLKPLKEFNISQITHYVEAIQLTRTLVTETSIEHDFNLTRNKTFNTNSIESILEQFLTKTTKEYPETISTINRTLEKIKSNTNNLDRCNICGNYCENEKILKTVVPCKRSISPVMNNTDKNLTTDNHMNICKSCQNLI